MGCVQQAVLEFDEEVRAPWRPRLVGDAAEPQRAVRSVSGRAPSRVAVCEPVPSGTSPARRRAAGGMRRGGESSVAASAVASPAASPLRVSAPSPVVSPASVSRSRQGLRPVSAQNKHVRLRLTRRARRLAFVLAVGVGIALGSWLDSLVGGEGDLRLAGESSVVVHSGDTLWSIASAVAGDGDVRAVVDAIQRANQLQGADLQPGQVLVLP